MGMKRGRRENAIVVQSSDTIECEGGSFARRILFISYNIEQ